MRKKITKKAKRGRPQRFSQEIADKIIAYVRMGNYVETAASAAGITKDTLYAWLKQGARGKSGLKRNFSDALTRAVEEANAADVSSIARAGRGFPVIKTRTTERPVKEVKKIKHSDGSITTEERWVNVTETTTEESKEFDWRAAAWRLERRNPRTWGRRDYVEANVNVTEKPVEDMSDREIDDEIQEIIGIKIAADRGVNGRVDD